MRHTLRILPAVAFSAILVGGAGGLSAAEDPIKVGVISPHSPPGSIAQGSEGRAGLEIAKSMINDNGGLLGQQVELVHVDSRGVPEDGRAAAERLITKENVDLLTGGIHSSVCMAVSDVVHKHHEVFMNVNCWSDAIREKGYAEWWNTSINNSRIAVGGAETVKQMGAKEVFAFAENTDFGIGLAKKFGKHLEKVAPDVAYDYQVADRESKDFSAQIAQLKQDPPDIVATIMDPPGGYIMINQLYQQGVAPTSETTLLDLDALAELPDFWDNVDKGGKWMAGFVLFHPKMQLTDLGKTVAETRRETSDKAPSRLVFQGFDALWTLKDAVERAGRLKTDEVLNALKNTELKGSRGTITFNMEKGPFFQQWVEVPYAVIQYTEEDQPLAEAPIIAPKRQQTAQFKEPQM